MFGVIFLGLILPFQPLGIIDWEKQGDGPINSTASLAFASCMDDCHLLDLGFKGRSFTYQHGNLRERLDRALCNLAWQNYFLDCTITHLPLSSSNHCGLWIRMEPRNTPNSRNCFKFLSSWLDHEDFEQQVKSSWVPSDNWNDNISRVTSNLKIWNKYVFGNIFQRKKASFD